MSDEPVELESEDKKEHKEYEIQSAADTLLKAEEIRADKVLHSKALEILKGKQKNLQKITSMDELRDVAKKKIKENDNEKI